MSLSAMMVVSVVYSAVIGRGDHVVLGGGGPMPTAVDCVPAPEKAIVDARVAANRVRLGLPAGSFVPAAATEGGIAGDDPFAVLLYPFWPQAGNNFQDLAPLLYVDVDPAPGSFIDYDCHPFTYDGHAGIDSTLLSFAEQIIGVPVFAALDGVVVDAHDGEPDQNIVPQGTTNIVVLDHGLGRTTSYYHLKKDSVAVSLGQFVKAGTQIGQTGSSGYSFGPHLHFQSEQVGPSGNQPYEPFAGSCRSGVSGFLNQPPESLVNVLINAGITDVDPANWQPLPYPLPVISQATFATPKIYLWLQTMNLPANATWRFQVKRPNGTIAYDTQSYGFFNPEIYRSAWYWWYFDIDEMQSLAGQWTIDVLFNEILKGSVPITVHPTVVANFNRPPVAITAALEPANPTFDQALICRISAPLIDDLDFDVIRFLYVWKVNGSVVRSVVSAGRSDMLARATASPGAMVTCTVTPSDGTVSGAAVVVSAALAGLCEGDLNHDGKVDAADLAILLGSWGLCG